MNDTTLTPEGQRRRGRHPGLALATTLTVVAIMAASSAVAVAQDDEAAAATDYAVLVRAELVTDDLDEAQLMHDAVASGAEEIGKAAGDFYHLAAVSTTLLGGTEGSFLGVDRWDAPDNIEAFYSEPAVAEALAALFASEPNVEVFERQPEWFSWGDMPDVSADDDFWVTVVRGTLAETDPDAAQAAHDLVAAGGQEPSMAAGDISHVVYTGVADPSEFLAFDVWESDENIEAVYGDPAFQAVFAPLFASPPSVVIYRSTDWHQW